MHDKKGFCLAHVKSTIKPTYLDLGSCYHNLLICTLVYVKSTIEPTYPELGSCYHNSLMCTLKYLGFVYVKGAIKPTYLIFRENYNNLLIFILNIWMDIFKIDKSALTQDLSIVLAKSVNSS